MSWMAAHVSQLSHTTDAIQGLSPTCGQTVQQVSFAEYKSRCNAMVGTLMMLLRFQYAVRVPE